MKSAATAAESSVIVVADDLIWESRLREAVERAGARSFVARGVGALQSKLQETPESVVIIDLNGHNYGGVEAVRTAAAAGRRVLAVGQHEDLDLRRLALAAGARRVFSYNKLFNDGPNVVTALLKGEL